MPDPILTPTETPQADPTPPVLDPPDNGSGGQDPNVQPGGGAPEGQSQQNALAQPSAIPGPPTEPDPAQPQASPIDPEILEAFEDANRYQSPPFQAQSTQEPISSHAETDYTNEQLTELRESDPVRYEQILSRKTSLAAAEAVKEQNEIFQNNLEQQRKSESLGRKIDVLINSTFPEYQNPQSDFKRDVDYVVKTMEKKPHINRLAACALVQLRTGQEKTIKTAEQRGAKQEQKRSANASQSIGGGSNPQTPQQQTPVDPWYVKYGPQFGADPAKLQERHDSAKRESKNTFMN